MDAKIEIKSIIDGEEFLNSYDGSVTFQGDVTLLSYEEIEEGVPASNKVVTSIQITKDEVLLEKSGAFSSKMIFKNEERTDMLYHTPYGDMPMQLECEKININRDSSLITIEILYKLYNSCDLISSHRLEIKSYF